MSARSRKRTAPFAVAAVAAALAVPASPAAAADPTLCVGMPACPGTNHASLEAALAAADASTTPDVIAVAAGTWTGDHVYNAHEAGNTVRITGAGAGRTVLRTATLDTVLDLLNHDTVGGDNVVEDLTIELPTVMWATGLSGYHVVARRIEVLVPAGDRANDRGRGGVQLTPGVLEDSTVTMATGGNTAVESAVRARQGAVVVSGSDLTAYTAVDGTGSAGDSVVVRRSRLHGPVGVRLLAVDVADPAPYAGVVDSTVVTPAAGEDLSTAITVTAPDGAVGEMTVRNVTIAGASEATGTGVQAFATGTGVAHATVANTVIRGVDDALMLVGAGTRTVTATTSSLDPARYPADPGMTVTGNVWPADPRWADAAAGDFRLLRDSGLVDAGAAGALAAGASATDVAGGARLVDGDGDGDARVDIGAAEYQRTAPVAVPAASATVVLAGDEVTFDGSGSTDADPGETLAHAWTFDDGAAASGATARHAFATPGLHTATLRVVDPTGQAGTASVVVDVRARPAATPPPLPQPPAARALALTGLRMSPATLKRGRSVAVRFTLSRAATVTLRVERLQQGRRSGTRCVVGRRAGKRCTRVTTVRGAITRTAAAGTTTIRFTGRIGGRALAPGRYRLVATAAAGAERTAAARATFRVAR